MFGTVSSNLEAVIRLRVHGRTSFLELDAVLDTGYDGYLTLPPAVVATLGLAMQGTVQTVLADGTIRRIDRYTATIDWDGLPMSVAVIAVGDEPLIGMSLLYGHSLHLDILPGGPVELRPIP